MECPASRIREEIMKILRRTNSHKGYELLAAGGILEHLFPRLDEFRLSCLQNNPTSADPLLQHLEVIEKLHSKGAELSDSVLLASLTSPPVMSSFETLPPGSDVAKWLHQYLEENFKPLAIPRVVRSRVHLLHLALRYMVAEKRRKRRRSLRRSPLFADALKFLEIHCLATKKHRSALHRWQRPPMNHRRRRRKTKSLSPKRIS
jgi:tRNA nucleotidyltransferase/poly(A) polymerase